MIGRERLTQMYREWEMARMRAEMAEKSLAGARLDLVAKEARFRGAIEVLAGAEATWTFDATEGVQIHEGGEVPAKEVAQPAAVLENVSINGHEVTTLEELAAVQSHPNRQVRRAMARVRRTGPSA